MAPPGAYLMRNDRCFSSGPVENEYERVWSVPGTDTLTYWPGRNARAPRSSSSTVRANAPSARRSTAVTVAGCAAAAVLAMSEVVGICTPLSDCGIIWHGRHNQVLGSWVLVEESVTVSPTC